MSGSMAKLAQRPWLVVIPLLGVLAVVGVILGVAARRSGLTEAPPSDIKSDEVVVFFPTFARTAEGGRSWTVPIHGCILEPEADSVKRSLLVTGMRRLMGLQLTTQEKQTLETRLRLFLVDHERGKTIWVRIGPTAYSVGTSGPNGHFEGELSLSADEVEDLARSGNVEDGWLAFQAVTRPKDDRTFSGRVLLADPTGLSVISDIDDTIKITEVRNRRAMLANTFVRPFQPVPGMAGLYRKLAAAKATFHYVSASPWQLYDPLRDFCRNEGFPRGTFHMKYFRLTDSSAMNLFGSQEEYKPGVIEEILAGLPGRRFVLIGDSGEQDPEIYGRIARDHPDQVAAVFIRDVRGETARSERFAKAFEGIAPDRWRLFQQAQELEPLVSRLVEKPP